MRLKARDPEYDYNAPQPHSGLTETMIEQIKEQLAAAGLPLNTPLYRIASFAHAPEFETDVSLFPQPPRDCDKTTIA